MKSSRRLWLLIVVLVAGGILVNSWTYLGEAHVERKELKNFPIQYQTVDEGETTTTTFSDIKMDKPDASLFELPENYKKYANMQGVMMGNMQRLMQQPP